MALACKFETIAENFYALVESVYDVPLPQARGLASLLSDDWGFRKSD